LEAAAVGAHRGERPVRFVALERQHTLIEHKLHGAFTRLLCTNAFTLGEEVERFEAEFAEYSEVAHCIGVASGTAALSLILEGYGIGPGDEVIVPAHTFIASALAVTHVGATAVLCDVDEATGLIDPEAARAAISPRTAAVLAVHLYGQACNMAAIEAFAKPGGLLVLEEAGHAHGARYCGHRAGSLGAAAAFSFYPSKNLGALGNAGAVCTDDNVLAVRLRRMRNLGQRSKGEHVDLGYNERLDALQAAMLRAKLPHLDSWNEARRAHAERYRALLPDEVRIVEERDESPSVNHLFAVRLQGRDAVAAALHADGVETQVHYPCAVHQHPAWRDGLLLHGDLPQAEAWAAEELSLPMHPCLRPSEVDRVAEALQAAVFRPYVVAKRPVISATPVRAEVRC
jgi:dTDP-3-amino-3,4,6-trideoxy-alpha-D-glucose transaminase